MVVIVRVSCLRGSYASDNNWLGIIVLVVIVALVVVTRCGRNVLRRLSGIDVRLVYLSYVLVIQCMLSVFVIRPWLYLFWVAFLLVVVLNGSLSSPYVLIFLGAVTLGGYNVG